MKRFALIALLLLSLLPQLAEGGKVYVVHYDVRLASVSRNGVMDSAHPITSEPFNDLEGTKGTRFHFADEVLNMTWYVSDTAFNYTLKNDFALPTYLPTKDVSFSDTKKRRDRMGFDLEGSKDRPVFTINAGTFISGFFIPWKNYPKGKKETDFRPILPNSFPTKEEAQEAVINLKGKTMRLTLPITQGGVRYSYVLTFEIAGITGFTEKIVPDKPSPRLTKKARAEYVVRYKVRLDEVSCDRNVGYRQGITSETFTDLDGKEGVRWRYADDIIGAVWYVSDIALNFSMVNKRQAAMMIPWKSVNYRDVDRLQSGVGYTLERTDELMPSFVPGGTGLSGFLIPDINYPTEGDVEQEITPLLPTHFRTRAAALTTSRSLVGRTMRVHVPMLIGRTQLNYYFTFVVDKVASITKQTVSEPITLEASTAGIDFSADDETLLTLPETLVDDIPAVVPKWDDIDKSKKDALVKLRYLASYYNYFLRVCPQERVYLHLDNTAYFQGETIWYAAYVTDDMGYPNPSSKILYVELLSPTGVIIKQQKLKIEHGRCHGSFPLVDTSVLKAIDRRGATNLPSGYYQIRAYTHSMLNFDDASIFSRVIPVYQFPKQEGRYDDPVVGEYPYHEIYRPEPKKEKPKELTVNFFPEGGHLISGIACTIAFKATDDNGLGVNIEEMRTADGQAISLSPQHRGMGRFDWLTQKGGEQVIVTAGGKEFKYTLPKAEPQGCALHLSREGDDLIAHIDAVGLTKDTLLAYTLTGRGQLCGFDTLSVNAKNDTIYSQMGDSPVMMRQVNTQAISYDISVPVRRCPTGVYQFTIYNPAGDILAQRMLFIDNGIPTQPITFTATKPEYRPFERIQMTFQTEGHPLQTFSLAVRDAADYGTVYHDDIRTYMLLSSELKGLIEDPGWYFESDHTHALDLLMLVQGWTRYDWQRMAGVTPFKVTHYTEQQLILEGWAFSRILETPLQNTKVDVTLVSPDREFEQRATVTTDAEGYWSVGLQDFEGKWHLYYHTEQDKKIMKKATTRMRLERSYKPPLHPYTPIETYLPDPKTANALLPSWREDIDDFVMPHDAIPLQEVEVTAGTLYVDYGTFHAYDAAADCEEIFDNGDYTYRLRDYLYHIGFFGDRYDATVYDHTVHRYVIPMINDEVLEGHNWRLVVETNPIDPEEGEEVSIPVDEEFIDPVDARIMGADMEYIKSVMVYDTISTDPRFLPSFKRFVNRHMSSEGYQEFLRQMYRGDKFLIAEVEYGDAAFSERRQKNERLTTFDGYSRVAEFYAPTYPDGPVQGDKDYRRTIYWNPAVTTDANGRVTLSFYNNGYSRSFAVSAQGLTSDGTPIINE